MSDAAKQTPTTEANLTAQQLELARHALGLPNSRRMSYRNRFVAGPGHTNYDAWCQMVGRGFAKVTPGYKLPFGGDDLFRVTLAGARAALMPREELDPEDFPNAR